MGIKSLGWYDANTVPPKNDKRLIMKSAREDSIQLARLRGYIELRCVCKYLLKNLMVRRFLREIGREFKTDDPENTRLVMYRSIRGSW